LKKEGDEYRKLPFSIMPENCCKILFENDIFKKAMENQNVPKECPLKEVSSTARIQSTDHELIPAKNPSLVMFVTIQRENIRPSKREMNKAVALIPNCPMFAVRL
jgi:hypothetical protein